VGGAEGGGDCGGTAESEERKTRSLRGRGGHAEEDARRSLGRTGKNNGVTPFPYRVIGGPFLFIAFVETPQKLCLCYLTIPQFPLNRGPTKDE
jgi:hypothetical protein